VLFVRFSFSTLRIVRLFSHHRRSRKRATCRTLASSGLAPLHLFFVARPGTMKVALVCPSRNPLCPVPMVGPLLCYPCLSLRFESRIARSSGHLAAAALHPTAHAQKRFSSHRQALSIWLRSNGPCSKGKRAWLRSQRAFKRFAFASQFTFRSFNTRAFGIHIRVHSIHLQPAPQNCRHVPHFAQF
jgi:hypothetical protein